MTSKTLHTLVIGPARVLFRVMSGVTAGRYLSVRGRTDARQEQQLLSRCEAVSQLDLRNIRSQRTRREV